MGDHGPLLERAEAWLSGRGGEPLVPKPASTVMIVRDGDAGLEVFMLRRVASMAFAPRMMVFPGGGVDPRDADPHLPWSGPSPEEWAGRLSTDEPTARLLVAAAAREVFEECGVLLAGPTPDTVIADVTGPQWRDRRDALLSREASLAELLVGLGLTLRTDLLGYRAHWITPEFESRRYDTHFFSAVVPQGQVADDQTSEADHADWTRPADMLEAWREGRALMLPPTIVSLEQASEAGTAVEFVAAQPRVATIEPVPVRTADGLVMRAELP
jgi:8-oxo-dGTP pyrophosphatase MutT (NUDIX family)